MKTGRVSQTALKVALITVALNEKEGWSERLPQGMVALSERLLLAASAFGYGPRMLRWTKRPWMTRIYEWSEARRPGSFVGIGQRKLFMNEHVIAAIEAGVKQVLVVGAGFDTLCLRLAPQFPHVHFFEVDHPATSVAKAKGVAREGKPPNMAMLEADLAQTPLSRVMRTQDAWDAQAPSVLVAEGLLMYLTREQVQTFFREAASCTGSDSRLAFSHLLNINPYGRVSRWGLRLVGEPWLWAMTREHLPAFVEDLGWAMMAQDERRSEDDLEGFAVATR